MSLEYKINTEFEGEGFKSIAELSKGEINDLELLYMAYGSLHATALLWAKMAFRTHDDGVIYPEDNVTVWANILSDMMEDLQNKMSQQGIVNCSCKNGDENTNKHQSFLQFSTNWQPEQLN